MSVAYEPAKVEPVIVRDLTPALASLVHGNNVVEGQIGSISRQPISQQMRVLQFTPAKSRRCPL